MNETLLSICIPTYSRPKQLRICLLNIIKQCKDIKAKIEIIICDDAPHDPAKKEIADLLEKHRTLRYHLNKENIGLDRNFVQLMQKARGKYLVFITDDDVFALGSLQNLVEALSTEREASVIAGARNIYKNGDLLRVERLFSTNRHFHVQETKDLAKILYDVNILSGLCLRKQDLDYRAHEQFYGSLFAHLHIVGLTLLKRGAFYISTPLVDHTIENEVFWKYSADFYLKEKIDLAESIMRYSSGLGYWLRAEFLKSAAYMIYTQRFQPKKLFALIHSLIKNKYYRYPYITFILQGFPELLAKKLSHSQK